MLPHVAQFEGAGEDAVGRLELADDGSFRLALHFSMLDVRWEISGDWRAVSTDNLELVAFSATGFPRLFRQAVEGAYCGETSSWEALPSGQRFHAVAEENAVTISGPCVPIRLARVR